MILPLLFLLSAFFPVEASVAVSQTCTASHIWLRALAPDAILFPTQDEQCVSMYGNQTVIDRRCSVAPAYFEVSPSQIRFRMGLVRPSCPSVDGVFEAKFPFNAKIHVLSGGMIQISIDEPLRIILSSAILPADCFLFSSEGPRHIQLSDEKGCIVENRMSLFEETQNGRKRLFRAFLRQDVFSMTFTRLQCSLVLLESPTPCDSKIFLSSAERILLSTDIPGLQGTSALSSSYCSWSLTRLTFLILVILLTFSTIISLYLSFKNSPWTTKEILSILCGSHGSKRELHIVHPIDHFKSPPVVTKHIPLYSDSDGSLTQSPVSEYSSSSDSTYSDNDGYSVFLSDALMESLPDPPVVPVAQLSSFVSQLPIAKARSIVTRQMDTPTPVARTLAGESNLNISTSEAEDFTRKKENASRKRSSPHVSPISVVTESDDL